jgi:hypothetical protein
MSADPSGAVRITSTAENSLDLGSMSLRADPIVGADGVKFGRTQHGRLQQPDVAREQLCTHDCEGSGQPVVRGVLAPTGILRPGTGGWRPDLSRGWSGSRGSVARPSVEPWPPTSEPSDRHPYSATPAEQIARESHSDRRQSLRRPTLRTRALNRGNRPRCERRSQADLHRASARRRPPSYVEPSVGRPDASWMLGLRGFALIGASGLCA